MPDLDRFITAQADAHSGFDIALGELRAGQKRGHWIWYVFPQLAGLGMSAMSMRYGIHGVEEATEYLKTPLLRHRLLAVSHAVASHLARTPDGPLARLMGSEIDARKVVSSMTLFGEVARRLNESGRADEYAALSAAADVILRAAAMQGIPACAFTLEQLRRQSP